MTKVKSKLAFEVEPNKATYRLRLARYPALVENLKRCLDAFDKQQPANTSPQAITYNVLDVGVGRGRTFMYAETAGISDRFNWSGVDLSRFPSENRAGGDRWEVKIANIEEGLPYPDNTFEVVILEQILEHLKDVEFAISEVTRVTKPGGRLIIGVPIFIAPLVILRNFYIKKFPRVFEKSGSQHIQTFSKASISRLIVANGALKIQDTRGFRIISGGVLRFLENYTWWYDFNCKLGQIFPSLCVEIQILVKKSTS